MNKTFELNPEHIKLLRAAVVSWEDCEFGAPAIDCKRPYGNTSVLQDIHEILGDTMVYNEDEFPKGLAEQYHDLHLETKTALQIILSTGSFTPGTYVASEYRNDWRLS